MLSGRRDLLPGWRAGLLVLGLYAMLLQAFFAGLAAPMHAAAFDPGVTCVSAAEAQSSQGEKPTPLHRAHDCVCPALCHPGGLPSNAVASVPAFYAQAAARALPDAWLHIPATSMRYPPPARAPPHAGFVLQS
jgi:hypothetical protein